MKRSNVAVADRNLEVVGLCAGTGFCASCPMPVAASAGDAERARVPCSDALTRAVEEDAIADQRLGPP
jgi:hypothetical protein